MVAYDQKFARFQPYMVIFCSAGTVAFNEIDIEIYFLQNDKRNRSALKSADNSRPPLEGAPWLHNNWMRSGYVC